MENAVKALLMAAGVLIGVMILSLGVTLYSSLNTYVETSKEEMVSKQVQQFNEQFTKYINCNNFNDETEFTLTIQDIVTAANTAYENNQSYGLTTYENNNYYVTVKLNGVALEQKINTETAKILEDLLGQEVVYKCRRKDVKINEITGRVYEVNFRKIAK